jgi:hypothetical protein
MCRSGLVATVPFVDALYLFTRVEPLCSLIMLLSSSIFFLILCTGVCTSVYVKYVAIFVTKHMTRRVMAKQFVNVVEYIVLFVIPNANINLDAKDVSYLRQ